MNFGNIVIMMSKFGSKSGDFAQRETLRSGVDYISEAGLVSVWKIIGTAVH